jgi:CheY-like chemotaxis protein
MQIIPSASRQVFPLTLRAFIVTDISLVRWDIADRLGDAGLEVVEGACGKDTLSSIQPEDRFDLIFLDIRAPWGPCGTDLARELRERFPDATIVASPEHVNGDAGNLNLIAAETHDTDQLVRFLISTVQDRYLAVEKTPRVDHRELLLATA